MNPGSVLIILLCCTSAFAYSTFILPRHPRSLQSSKSSPIQLNENEIQIDPLSDELPENIRRKKSTKKERLSLEDLKKGDSGKEINNSNKFDDQSLKKSKKKSSLVTLQEVHGLDKNQFDENSEKYIKENDRSRRQYMVPNSLLNSESGDNMLIMPKPNSLSFHPRTHHGISVGVGDDNHSAYSLLSGPTIHSVAQPSAISTSGVASGAGTYAAPMITSLPIKHPIAVQTLIAPPPPPKQTIYYSAVVPSHPPLPPPTPSSSIYLCPCSYQHGYNYHPGYSNIYYPDYMKKKSDPQINGIHFPQISESDRSMFDVSGKSVSNIDDDILQTPYIFQGPRMHFSSLIPKAAQDSHEGHQHTRDCNMETLSNLNLDKSALEGLMQHEEKKLKKIDDCAKNNNLNAVEYSTLVNMVNNEIELLQKEVKGAQRLQQQQVQQQQQPQQQHQRSGRP